MYEQEDQYLRSLPGPVGVLETKADLDELVEAVEDVTEVLKQDSRNTGMFTCDWVMVFILYGNSDHMHS